MTLCNSSPPPLFEVRKSHEPERPLFGKCEELASGRQRTEEHRMMMMMMMMMMGDG